MIVSTFRTGHRGLVRIGGTPVFMDGVISAMIAEFHKSYPNVRMEQSYAYATELMEQLLIGSLDLAILPTLPDGFQFTSMLPGRNVIARGSDHPLIHKRPLRLSDIAFYPWIPPPTSSPLYQDMRNILTEIGVTDFKISFSGGSLASIVNILSDSDA